MKKELSKIIQELEQGTITEEEARPFLLGLLGVSGSLIDDNFIKKQYNNKICDENQVYEYPFDAFVAGARWMRRLILFGNDR